MDVITILSLLNAFMFFANCLYKAPFHHHCKNHSISYLFTYAEISKIHRNNQTERQCFRFVLSCKKTCFFLLYIWLCFLQNKLRKLKLLCMWFGPLYYQCQILFSSLPCLWQENRTKIKSTLLSFQYQD